MGDAALSVGANSTSTNRFIGKVQEFIRRRTPYQFAAVGSAAGLTCLFIIGETVIFNGEAISSSNRYPNEKDDVSSRGIINPGSRLLLSFSNSTAGALTVNWFLDIS
jgi:hypothetical protein